MLGAVASPAAPGEALGSNKAPRRLVFSDFSVFGFQLCIEQPSTLVSASQGYG